MARNVQTTTINLDMSATQARSALRALQTQAKQLERDLAACQNPNRARRLQTELNRVNSLMRSMQTNARNAEQVMARLDSATPNELRRTLSTLNRQLGNMRQGTEEYIRTSANIQRVRDQLNTVNASISSQTSLWDRLKNAGTGAVAMVMGAVGAAQRLVSMARENVEIYASMEGEMANVRKYSGMTEEQVEKLNEEFRKMDTRSSREDLNRLAQDAGRLGKQSVEDVLGFVRAADQINVALDDLGDGATLTLSKLAGLFGIEEKYGTEQGLLKVGSVINDLSQNCSAAAPYIAEFTSRMGAAGVQAGMTVPQIMAYAAVMDECNVNVEASSTALSQLIIKLFKDPAKYAKAAGLEVKEFYATLTQDANEGFLTLIEALSKKGGLDKLAPVFAEMGANGSEAQKALGLLAQNIDKVRRQQDVANESFELGTSISAEFDVQNNTVAAGLDKARKEITETRVEIGQKLLPVVESSLQVTSAAMKVVSVLVSVLMNNAGALGGAAAAWAAYKVAMAAANAETKIMLVLQKGYSVVATAAKSATLLATAATARLTGNLGRATAAMRLFRSTASLSSGGIGLLVTGLGLAVGALITYIKRKEEAAEAERKHRNEINSINSQLENTRKQAERDARSELNRAKDLYTAATTQTSAMNLRLEAAKKLIALYPETFRNMTAEEIALGKAKTAYENLTQAILLNARAKAAAKQVQENEEKRLALEQKIDELRENRSKVAETRKNKQAVNDARANAANQSAGTVTGAIAMQGGSTAQWEKLSTQEETDQIITINGQLHNSWEELLAVNKSTKRIMNEFKDDRTFRKEMGAAETQEVTVTPTVTPTELPTDPKEKKKAEAAAKKARKAAEKKAKEEFKKKLEQEEAARKFADAMSIAAHTTGLIKYSEFRRQMTDHEVEMYEEKIRIYTEAGLADDEDVADMRKRIEQAKAKYQGEREKLALSDIAESRTREENQAQLDYVTPGSAIFRDEEGLQRRLFEIRLKWLEATRDLYAEGTEQRAKAINDIEEAEAAEQLRLQKLTMSRLAEYEEKYTTLPLERRRDLELAALDALHEKKLIKDEDYEKVRKSIAKKYEKEIKEARENIDSGTKDEPEQYKAGNEFAAMVQNMYDSWRAFLDTSTWDMEDWAANIGSIAQAAFAVFSFAMQSASQLMSANAAYDVAVVEKAYDRQITLARDNSARQQRLEEQKEKAVAAARAKSAKRDFALQVATAIAQTAYNAIQAYCEGLKVGGIAGLVLAPIAAAMAVTAGAVQIATIKKQQQTAALTGYSSGGFTPKGGVDQPAGIVHAGEWVASQKLVNNPATRPLIDMLEYARTHNTLPAISAEDVSGSVMAPVLTARHLDPASPANAGSRPRTGAMASPTDAAGADSVTRMVEAVERLNEHLAQPIRATVSVSGSEGVDQATRRYRQLMANKKK